MEEKSQKSRPVGMRIRCPICNNLVWMTTLEKEPRSLEIYMQYYEPSKTKNKFKGKMRYALEPNTPKVKDFRTKAYILMEKKVEKALHKWGDGKE